MRNYVSGMLLLPEDVAYMTRAANAFDEVLAVAKAGAFLSLRVNELTTSFPRAGEWEHDGVVQAMRDVWRAVDALDQAYPGWREWV